MPLMRINKAQDALTNAMSAGAMGALAALASGHMAAMLLPFVP